MPVAAGRGYGSRVRSFHRRCGFAAAAGLAAAARFTTGGWARCRCQVRRRLPCGYDLGLTDRLYFTEDEAANRLLADEPLALLLGFLLDQQVTVQKAFAGPLAIRERLGSLDAATLADADLDAVFRARPAIHRFPGAMAAKAQELGAIVRDEYGGDAARLWTEAADAADLRARLLALPGFGEMKVKSLASVLYHRFGVAVARDLIPTHPTLGDVDSPAALASYQAGKRAQKAALRKARAAGMSD